MDADADAGAACEGLGAEEGVDWDLRLMVYLVVIRVYPQQSALSRAPRTFVIGREREQVYTVVGRAERRREEFSSQDCAFGR